MHRNKYTLLVAEVDDASGDDADHSRLGCNFFRTDQGNEPVRDWIRSLSLDVKKEIGSDIERVQWQWPVSKPLVDGLGGGLYEVRTKFERVQYRVLFCIAESTMVLLHGFVKKSRTEPVEIALGRERQKAVRKDQARVSKKKEAPP